MSSQVDKLIERDGDTDDLIDLAKDLETQLAHATTALTKWRNMRPGCSPEEVLGMLYTGDQAHEQLLTMSLQLETEDKLFKWAEMMRNNYYNMPGMRLEDCPDPPGKK